MKNLTLPLILLLSFHETVFPQSCLPDGINFTTQAQIDSFQVNYPNCTQIQGEMLIGDFGSGETDITNLNGLSVLTSIGGRVWIAYNDSLTSLSGLDNITHIGGGLWISDNDNLINLAGLESLTSIDGFVEIQDHISLTDLSGLNSLTSIGDGLALLNNVSLTSLAGLSNLTSVGGGILRIVNNAALTSLTGLNNIDTSSITVLQVHNNPGLSFCAVPNICDYIADTTNDIIIFFNSAGCNSPEEVDSVCTNLSVGEIKFQSTCSIYPNPSSAQITIEAPTTPGKNTFMTIFNINGQQLIKRQITEQQTLMDVSGLPQGVYFVQVRDDRTVMVSKFIRQ